MHQLRKKLLDTARNQAERHFDAKTLMCLIPRETCWYAITLLESEKQTDVELANAILASLCAKDGTHTPCALYLIYRRYYERLGEKARQNILDNLAENLPISAAVRYSDGNINHPVAAFVNLLCSGELLQEPVYTRLGRQNLIQLKAACNRRHLNYKQSELSEYNSPTYTALTIWFLALAAEFASDDEGRRLSRFLEERTWFSVAMHWHNPTQQFAGPFSRAYAEDSIGGYSALHCTLAYAAKKNLFIDFSLPQRFQHPSALIQNAFIAALCFHLPKAAKQIAFEKPFPYHFRMITYCEQYHENRFHASGRKNVHRFDDQVYAGGWGELTTYMSRNYCLATASRPYVNAAQADQFSLRYRCTDHIGSLEDFRSIYCRMVFNKARVGQTYPCHITGSPIGPDYLYEEGRALTFQQRNKAIVLYAPKRCGHKNIEELRLDILLAYNKPFDGIRVDGKRVKEYPLELDRSDWIVISDHRIYLAIHPLAVPVSGYRGKTVLQSDKDHFIISLYNYQGKKRDFSRHEMSLIRNGFVFFIDDRSRMNTLPEIDFSCEEKQHSDGRRRVVFSEGGEILKFVVDALGERILEKKYNGREQTIYQMQVDCPASDPIFSPVTLYDL